MPKPGPAPVPKSPTGEAITTAPSFQDSSVREKAINQQSPAAASVEDPDAMPPPTRSASPLGWALSDEKGEPVSMASSRRSASAQARGRSARAGQADGRTLSGISEEDFEGKQAARSKSPRGSRRPRRAPAEAELTSRAGAPATAAPRSPADAMADAEAADLRAEAEAHAAQAAQDDLAQAARDGTVFQVAPPDTAHG